MDVKQINSAIMFGDFTNDQLNSIIDAVKYRKASTAKRVTATLRIGDNVNFTSTKTGQNLTGFVTKVAVKYVTVKTVQGLWKVPANMLTRIEEVA